METKMIKNVSIKNIYLYLSPLLKSKSIYLYAGKENRRRTGNFLGITFAYKKGLSVRVFTTIHLHKHLILNNFKR